MIKIIVSLSFFVFIFGCTPTQQQYFINAGMILAEAETLEGQYIDISNIVDKKQNESDEKIFTDSEYRELMNIKASIDMLVTKYHDLSKMDVAYVSIEDLDFLWEMAVKDYDRAREIFSSKWKKFDAPTQILLNQFDRKANDTAVRLNSLINEKTNESMNEALVTVLDMFGLALKVIGTGVVAL